MVDADNGANGGESGGEGRGDALPIGSPPLLFQPFLLGPPRCNLLLCGISLRSLEHCQAAFATVVSTKLPILQLLGSRDLPSGA